MNGRRFATETPLCNEKGGGRYALNVRTSAYSFGINDRTYKKEKQNNDNKVAMRNHRRDGMDVIKKMKTAKELSEDQAADCEAEVEKLISKYMTKLEEIISAKEKELMYI